MIMDITLKGEIVASITPRLEGSAPDFTLLNQHEEKIKLFSCQKPVILSIFPDINTSVCSLQTRRFNQEAANHKEIDFLSISTNTIEEQRNWCAAEGVDMNILSDEDGDFGKKYGLLITEGPLKGKMARAVFVVKYGEIVYAQVLSEVAQEPDYEVVLKAVNE
ncbi:MAG: thiol peroxidase [Streptococcaceae bacterium]|nr:thiol peroxidase [Streptococcaceae bacterium]